MESLCASLTLSQPLTTSYLPNLNGSTLIVHDERGKVTVYAPF